MNSIDQIEAAIRSLPDEDLATLRAWFTEYDANHWDRQFERDVAEGRLDALAEESLQDARAGRCAGLLPTRVDSPADTDCLSRG